MEAARHDGAGAAAEQIGADHIHRHAVEPHIVAKFAAGIAHPKDQSGEVMLQILSDRQIDQGLNAERPQLIGRSDA